MNRREALQGLAAGVATPMVAAVSSGASESSEAFCPERFETLAEYQAWLGQRPPNAYPTEICVRETDVRCGHESISWRWQAFGTVWMHYDPAPRAEIGEDAELALATLFKAEAGRGIWPAVNGRPFWAVRLHDGWRFYQTDANGAYYTFSADGKIQPHKGAPKYLPQ